MSKKLDTHLFITIFLLSSLIFIAGIFLGSKITEQKTEVLTDSYERLTIDTLSLGVQNLLLQEKLCQAEAIPSFTEELYQFSDRVAFLENNFGWDDPRVMAAKEKFSLLQIRHWLIMKKSSERCGDNRTFMLYFYSNRGDCDRCKQQGTVLTSLRRDREDTLVYYFDIHMDNPAMNTVKELYNVTAAPTLVINEETYKGFHDKNSVEKIINVSEDPLS